MGFEVSLLERKCLKVAWGLEDLGEIHWTSTSGRRRLKILSQMRGVDLSGLVCLFLWSGSILVFIILCRRCWCYLWMGDVKDPWNPRFAAGGSGVSLNPKGKAERVFWPDEASNRGSVGGGCCSPEYRRRSVLGMTWIVWFSPFMLWSAAKRQCLRPCSVL